MQGNGKAILIILDKTNCEKELEKNMFINICQGRTDFISLERKFLSFLFPDTKYSQYVFKNYSLCDVYLIHKNNNDKKKHCYFIYKERKIQLLR